MFYRGAIFSALWSKKLSSFARIWSFCSWGRRGINVNRFSLTANRNLITMEIVFFIRFASWLLVKSQLCSRVTSFCHTTSVKCRSTVTVNQVSRTYQQLSRWKIAADLKDNHILLFNGCPSMYHTQSPIARKANGKRSKEKQHNRLTSNVKEYQLIVYVNSCKLNLFPSSKLNYEVIVYRAQFPLILLNTQLNS